MSRQSTVRPEGRCSGRTTTLAVLLLAVAGSCARPRVATLPIDPAAFLDRARAERSACPGGSLSLGEATALMRRNSPAIRTARADAAVAQAVACVRTPYPNPTIEAGPLLFGGADILTRAAGVGFTAALGWTVLLTNTPALTDDVNRMRAAAAFAEAAAVEREQYLALRGEFADALLQADILVALRDLTESAQSSIKIAQRSVEAGEGTALDVDLLGLEGAEIQAEQLVVEEALATARGDLGARIGSTVCAEKTSPLGTELMDLPSEIPSIPVLQETVIEHHPRLSALRAAYLVVEKELRLEVARRYPPLGIAFEYERDDENTLGLPLGIEIPLFDRNQPGVAEACAHRTALREQFAAALNAALADAETSRARLEVRRRRLALHASQLGRARTTAQRAESVLRQTGTFEMLRYLEVLRATRRARIAFLESRASTYEAWSDLEKACGAPLLRFASEPGTTSPQQGDE